MCDIFFPTKALKTIKEHKAIKAYFRWKWPRITASRPFLILSNSQSLLGWELLILTFTLHLWREIKYGFFMSRHLTRFSLEMCPGGDGSPKWPIVIGITMCSDNRKKKERTENLILFRFNNYDILVNLYMRRY